MCLDVLGGKAQSYEIVTMWNHQPPRSTRPLSTLTTRERPIYLTCQRQVKVTPRPSYSRLAQNHDQITIHRLPSKKTPWRLEWRRYSWRYSSGKKQKQEKSTTINSLASKHDPITIDLLIPIESDDDDNGHQQSSSINHKGSSMLFHAD